MALPGRAGGRREARGASEDDDDDDDSSEEVDARDCVRVGCVSFEAGKGNKLINRVGFDINMTENGPTECLEIVEARIAAASGTSADAETLARVRE